MMVALLKLYYSFRVWVYVCVFSLSLGCHALVFGIFWQPQAVHIWYFLGGGGGGVSIRIEIFRCFFFQVLDGLFSSKRRRTSNYFLS